MSKIIHLKGLNGIRAIAALAVMFSHINLNLYQFNLENGPSIDLSGFGVTIFFALSGFLITYLLFIENEKQDIDIKKFYIRRALRIWPLYFLYLFLSLATIYYFDIRINSISLPYYFFLAANIPFVLNVAIPFITGYWSLGVEEQFYLFWPWLIKLNKNRVLPCVALFTLGFFGLRLLFRFIEFKYGYSLPYLAIHVTRFDCMAIGALGAVLFFNKNRYFLNICNNIILQVLAWATILLLALNKFHVASVIDHEIISIVTVVLILNVSVNVNSIIKLDLKIMDFIGKISYGIYIIHTLVIFLLAKFLNLFVLDNSIKYLLAYLGVVSLTLLLSYLSYEFFEKRFIRLKDKFSIVKSSSSFTSIDKSLGEKKLLNV